MRAAFTKLSNAFRRTDRNNTGDDQQPLLERTEPGDHTRAAAGRRDAMIPREEFENALVRGLQHSSRNFKNELHRRLQEREDQRRQGNNKGMSAVAIEEEVLRFRYKDIRDNTQSVINGFCRQRGQEILMGKDGRTGIEIESRILPGTAEITRSNSDITIGQAIGQLERITTEINVWRSSDVPYKNLETSIREYELIANRLLRGVRRVFADHYGYDPIAPPQTQGAQPELPIPSGSTSNPSGPSRAGTAEPSQRRSYPSRSRPSAITLAERDTYPYDGASRKESRSGMGTFRE